MKGRHSKCSFALRSQKRLKRFLTRHVVLHCVESSGVTDRGGPGERIAPPASYM